jgi:hypothetical protein
MIKRTAKKVLLYSTTTYILKISWGINQFGHKGNLLPSYSVNICIIFSEFTGSGVVVRVTEYFKNVWRYGTLIIGPVGVISNIIVIYIMQKERRSSSTIFFQAIAVFDTILIFSSFNYSWDSIPVSRGESPILDRSPNWTIATSHQMFRPQPRFTIYRLTHVMIDGLPVFHRSKYNKVEKLNQFVFLTIFM